MNTALRHSVALCAAALTILTASSIGGAATRSISFDHAVFGLSAAGPRVAIDGWGSDCDRIVIWEPARNAVRDEVRKCGDPSPVFGLGTSLLAGRRLVWSDLEGGNITEETLLARPLGAKRATTLATGSYASDGGGSADDVVENLTGRGSAFGPSTLVAWNTWFECPVVGPFQDIGCDPQLFPDGSPEPGSIFRDKETVWVFDGSKRRAIRRGAEAGPVLAVGGGLIALRLDAGDAWRPFEATLPAGVVTLVDPAGAVVGTIPVAAGVHRGAELTRTALIVVRDNALEMIDRATGQLTASWPVPAPSGRLDRFRLSSVTGGIATVVSGSTVHVVRLADGKRFVLKRNQANPETVDAELEPHGLYVAFTLRHQPGDTSVDRGRADFLPIEDVRSRLG